ncbi:hypothetical protein NRK67_02155 [Fusobacteria bacterium ZRK30]|nr:hypothetical protein NRK67_02155 [Fusobacteria bacterium ZRK30]
MYKIVLDMEKNEIDRYRKAAIELITLIRTFRKKSFKEFKIKIETSTGKLLDISHLENRDLYNDYSKHWKVHGLEFIFVLKLIELNMEDRASDVGWEIVKIAQSVQSPNYLFVETGYTFGLDILYAVAGTYPNWTKLFKGFLQESWDSSLIPPYSDMMKDIIEKHQEKKPRAWVKSYGIFGFASDFIAGVNISLTPPKLNRKAEIGSYIGCVYTLADNLFKDNSQTLNIFVGVEVKDFEGRVVHTDRWPDIAFKGRNNSSCFVAEEGELFEGHWKFTVTHNGKELYEQTIPVMVM